MLCRVWDCKVDMKIDNFLFWAMKKLREKTFKGNEELFQRNMPKIFAAIEEKGFDKYKIYQKNYAEKNRKYLEHCAEWRKLELRRLRFLDKLHDICKSWTWSDGEEDTDSDDETTDGKRDEENISDFSIESNYSMNTVINTSRYANYLETESLDIDHSVVDDVKEENTEEPTFPIGDVNSQVFQPQTTSTQQ